MKKYAVFSGRARRKEYWMFGLFQILFGMVAMIIDSMIGFNFNGIPYGVFYMIYGLATFVPSLSVFVRRLHDTNRSGWWILIGLIPLIGAIWLLVLLCTEGTAGDNKYGPDPKGQSSSLSNEALDGHLTS